MARPSKRKTRSSLRSTPIIPTLTPDLVDPLSITTSPEVGSPLLGISDNYRPPKRMTTTKRSTKPKPKSKRSAMTPLNSQKSNEGSSHRGGRLVRGRQLRRNGACDSCRKRRTRCDGVRPHCGACVKYHNHLSRSKTRGGEGCGCSYAEDRMDEDSEQESEGGDAEKSGEMDEYKIKEEEDKDEDHRPLPLPKGGLRRAGRLSVARLESIAISRATRQGSSRECVSPPLSPASEVSSAAAVEGMQDEESEWGGKLGDETEFDETPSTISSLSPSTAIPTQPLRPRRHTSAFSASSHSSQSTIYPTRPDLCIQTLPSMVSPQYQPYVPGAYGPTPDFSSLIRHLHRESLAPQSHLPSPAHLQQLDPTSQYTYYPPQYPPLLQRYHTEPLIPSPNWLRPPQNILPFITGHHRHHSFSGDDRMQLPHMPPMFQHRSAPSPQTSYSARPSLHQLPSYAHQLPQLPPHSPFTYEPVFPSFWRSHPIDQTTLRPPSASISSPSQIPNQAEQHLSGLPYIPNQSDLDQIGMLAYDHESFLPTQASQPNSPPLFPGLQHISEQPDINQIGMLAYGDQNDFLPDHLNPFITPQGSVSHTPATGPGREMSESDELEALLGVSSSTCGPLGEIGRSTSNAGEAMVVDNDGDALIAAPGPLSPEQLFMMMHALMAGGLGGGLT